MTPLFSNISLKMTSSKKKVLHDEMANRPLLLCPDSVPLPDNLTRASWLILCDLQQNSHCYVLHLRRLPQHEGREVLIRVEGGGAGFGLPTESVVRGSSEMRRQW